MLYYLIENESEDSIMLYTVRAEAINGAAQDLFLAGQYFIEPGERYYGFAFLNADTEKPVETIDLNVARFDENLNHIVHQVQVDLRGTEIITDMPDTSKGAVYSDEELLAIAREAEENSRNYSTVSTGKAALELPYTDEYLDVSERMTVGMTKNGALLILPKPATGYGNLGAINSGTEVTVIAECKGYYFFVADDGRMGWTGKDNLEA